MDLEQLSNRIERLEQRIQQRERCHEYEAMLRDVARTLRMTKQSFQSRQLKELRERVEGILES